MQDFPLLRMVDVLRAKVRTHAYSLICTIFTFFFQKWGPSQLPPGARMPLPCQFPVLWRPVHRLTPFRSWSRKTKPGLRLRLRPRLLRLAQARRRRWLWLRLNKKLLRRLPLGLLQLAPTGWWPSLWLRLIKKLPRQMGSQPLPSHQLACPPLQRLTRADMW